MGKMFKKEEWDIWKILTLVLGIVALACVITSMFFEGNNGFLIAGLSCMCAGLIIFVAINVKKK